MPNELETILKKFDEKFPELCEYNDFKDNWTTKNLDIKSFISSSLKALLESLVEDLEGEKKKTWGYGGGGGKDTDYWCKKGVCFSIPGIKQIVSYGINNDRWWTEYLMKWQVILPEKYKDDGFNDGLNLAQERIKKLIK